jgi:hypothetical protein
VAPSWRAVCSGSSLSTGEIADSRDGPAYRLGNFKAFLGQREHVRHQRFAAGRATIS